MTDIVALAISFSIVAFVVAFVAFYRTKKLQKQIDRLHQIEIHRVKAKYDRLQVPIPLDWSLRISKRRHLLDEIVRESQELGLYDDDGDGDAQLPSEMERERA